MDRETGMALGCFAGGILAGMERVLGRYFLKRHRGSRPGPKRHALSSRNNNHEDRAKEVCVVAYGVGPCLAL